LQIDSSFIDFCFSGFLWGSKTVGDKKGQDGDENGSHDFRLLFLRTMPFIQEFHKQRLLFLKNTIVAGRTEVTRRSPIFA
jgi:hypothetical protein